MFLNFSRDNCLKDIGSESEINEALKEKELTDHFKSQIARYKVIFITIKA